MVRVEFIADFATKKKGDVYNCDNMLASQLVNDDKVAKYHNEKEPKESKPKK